MKSRDGARSLQMSLLATIMICACVSACAAHDQRATVKPNSLDALVRYRDSESCGERLVSPIRGIRWQISCDGTTTRTVDSTCSIIRAQVAAVWFAPDERACVYSGSGEMLLHKADSLFRRIKFSSALGTPVHYFPCLEIAITIGKLDEQEPELVYRVVRFHDRPVELYRLGAGTLSMNGSRRRASRVKPLAIDMRKVTRLTFAAGSSEVLRVEVPRCGAPDSAVIVSSTKLSWHSFASSDSSTANRSVVLLSDRGESFELLRYHRGNLEQWKCSSIGACDNTGVITAADPVDIVVPCMSSFCIVTKPSIDSVTLRRRRIQ